MESITYTSSVENVTFPIFANETPGPSTNKSGINEWWKDLLHSPNWPDLWEQLRWAWELHIYGMACLFMAMACASFFTILGLRSQLSSRPHMSSLNVFLCLLGSTRALVLFIDPYESKKTMPLVMSRIMWDLGFPCLLSAFALLQLSFLRMSKTKSIVPSNRLSSETAASVIVTSHFCLIIMSDILWALRNSFRIVWLLTQLVFVLWGLFLCLTFLCGCLRLLRSVSKLPMPFLSQNEPGYEIKGVLPTDMKLPNGHGQSSVASNASSRPPHQPLRLPCPPANADNRLRPKIRITDVNDQTYSYISDGSPATGAFSEQRVRPLCKALVRPGPEYAAHVRTPRAWESTKQSVKNGDDSIRSLPILESTNRQSWSSCKTDVASHPEDPTLTRPLMSDRESAPANLLTDDNSPIADLSVSEIRQNGPATISSLHKGSSYVHRSHRRSDPLEEFKFDACKLKTNSRSRMEKLLRKLVVTSVLGTLLCLLRAYDVFGPHGLSSSKRHAAILPWFCYQTISRVVEFFMGCSMACLTRQSLHAHCYHYYGVLKKRRDPFIYGNQ